MCAPEKQKVSEEIVIRRIKPEDDLDRIKDLFRSGMIILVPEMVKITLKHRLTSLTLGHPIFMMAPLLLVGLFYWPWETAVRIYSVAVFTALVAWSAYIMYMCRKMFQKYINYSIADDLSKIFSVYGTNGGCFLVATHRDRIVGMVGGEFKENGEKGKIYELRRMSVDASMRGRGVGKLLVQGLEKELHQLSMLWLDCSNLQHPAHALYKGQGFEFVSAKTQYPGAPRGFEIWRWEKFY